MNQKASAGEPILDVSAPTLAKPLSNEVDDEPSVAAVFEEHARFVWRTVRRLGASEADAHDATQDVFLVVHRRLRDFESGASMRSWLYGICVKVLADSRKRVTSRREQLVEHVPEHSVAPSQETALDERQVRARLHAVLATLDPKKREVFVLFELEELTLAEIAIAVECPLQTAYSRLQAARKVVHDAFTGAAREGP